MPFSLAAPSKESSGSEGGRRQYANSASGTWPTAANAFSSLLTPSGGLINRLTIHNHMFSYRTVPAPVNAISAASLRAGMDAMYAAGGAG